MRTAPRIAVFTTEDRVQEALDAGIVWVAVYDPLGAAKAGLNNLIQEVKDGKIDFDIAIATPDCMNKLSPIAKVLCSLSLRLG